MLGPVYTSTRISCLDFGVGRFVHMFEMALLQEKWPHSLAAQSLRFHFAVGSMDDRFGMVA